MKVYSLSLSWNILAILLHIGTLIFIWTVLSLMYNYLNINTASSIIKI